ncbi:hypothetical protein [Bacteriovorax stolpii]|uniref:hypothetical protein n=1 Tax=Bacteriovorax stolpii TaxID=960 RepID=UPI00163CD5D2|nr:hypothetical protein [Bacteriovorax stolpii]
MKKRGSIILLLALLSSQAFGEYRVYQYYVRSKLKNINPTNAQLVTSTMNPTAYAVYHGGKDSIEVSLLRSWVCMGDTSKKSICSMSEGRELEGSAQ